MNKTRMVETERESHPSPIDTYVGSRIRLRRIGSGMTQEQLGSALKITFQQVQKYERGTNRVGASRLYEISRVLNVPVSYFFDEMPSGVSEAPISGPRGRTYGLSDQMDPFQNSFDDQLSKRETLELVKAYYSVADLETRKLLLDLMRVLGKKNDDAVVSEAAELVN